MRYLVDGYNVLHAMGLLVGEVGPSQLEHARQKLLQRIVGALGPEASHVIVFFDAAFAPRDLPRKMMVSTMQVIFSPPVKDADTVIAEWLRGMSARNTCVVSEDRRLRQAAKRRGCRHISPQQFFDWLEKRRRQRRRLAPSDDRKEALHQDANQSRWLVQFAPLDDDPNLGARDPFADLDISSLLKDDKDATT